MSSVRMGRGTLVVTVEAAKGLRNCCIYGQQNPFVLLKVGKWESRTHVLDGGGTNPVWNQELFLNVDCESTTLKVRVWHNGNIKKTKIGKVNISLSDVFAGRNCDGTYSLLHKNGAQQGVIVLRIKFRPASPVRTISTRQDVAALRAVSAGATTSMSSEKQGESSKTKGNADNPKAVTELSGARAGALPLVNESAAVESRNAKYPSQTAPSVPATSRALYPQISHFSQHDSSYLSYATYVSNEAEGEEVGMKPIALQESSGTTDINKLSPIELAELAARLGDLISSSPKVLSQSDSIREQVLDPQPIPPLPIYEGEVQRIVEEHPQGPREVPSVPNPPLVQRSQSFSHVANAPLYSSYHPQDHVPNIHPPPAVPYPPQRGPAVNASWETQMPDYPQGQHQPSPVCPYNHTVSVAAHHGGNGGNSSLPTYGENYHGQGHALPEGYVPRSHYPHPHLLYNQTAAHAGNLHWRGQDPSSGSHGQSPQGQYGNHLNAGWAPGPGQQPQPPANGYYVAAAQPGNGRPNGSQAYPFPYQQPYVQHFPGSEGFPPPLPFGSPYQNGPQLRPPPPYLHSQSMPNYGYAQGPRHS